MHNNQTRSSPTLVSYFASKTASRHKLQVKGGTQTFMIENKSRNDELLNRKSVLFMEQEVL